MAEDSDEKNTTMDAGKTLGSGLDEIGWQPDDRRILLKPRPHRAGLRRQSVTSPGDGQE